MVSLFPPAAAGSREAPMMPNINRLTGRFFTVLISLSIAIFLPRAVMAGEAIPPPPLASPAGADVLPALRLNLLTAPLAGGASSPTLCQISDTVYRADGSPAQGTVLLTWQAFTTAAGQSVTPGSLLVTLDANGGFNASLAPNTGASPAGSYYKAIFKLNDGTTETELWVVPNTQTTTIGAIRSKLVPASQAAQFLTRDVADSIYVSVASTQTIGGTKTFSSSPAVPTPQNPSDAANKSYVDANGVASLGSPPPIGTTTPNAGRFTDLAASLFPTPDVRAFGAVGDGQVLNGGCAINAGSYTLTCPSGTFASTDVGKTISVGFAGASGCSAYANPSICPLITTISAYTSSTTVTLAASAVTSVSGGNGTIVWGADNRPAIQAAINFAAASQVSEFALYIPHALGQGSTNSAVYPGCYLVNGTIALPDSISNTDLKWLKIYGDGNDASALCQADPTKDLIAINQLSNAGTQDWIDGIGFLSPGGYRGAPYIHCINCVDFRATNNWMNASLAAMQFDNPNQIVQIWGNTFENTVQAIVYSGYRFLDVRDNTIDETALNWAYYGSGAPSTPYAITVSNTTGLKIDHNTFFGVGRGIKCVNCVQASIVNNDFTDMGEQFAGLPKADFAYQNLSLSATAANLSRLITVTGNHFSSVNSEAIDLVGSNSSILFAGNNYTYQGATPQQYMVWTATNGANTGVTVTHEVIDSCAASPCISIASGAMASSLLSSNYFASSITIPIAVAGGVPSGSYVAFNSQDAAVNGLSAQKADVAGDLTVRDIPGVEYHVSKYASIQAAINAAYNNGAVLGTVIDDRTAPYSGPGFILYDSVTLKLAATTYTINSTVSYNNGNNNVTAGIIALPGAKLIGASTSTNHGTIVTAGNGLNADLIATSTVGTGIAAAAQWWHWGGFENLRVMGNGANQTAGNCFNIENMGETAFLRTIEVSGCHVDNILFTGASATPSDIANITTNSAGRYGFNFNNLAGMAVVHGLSGDSNTTSLVRLNGGQSGTLTILGFKTEEEVSGQDPLITIDQTGQNNNEPSLFIVGGYTFGRNGVNDVIKYVNGAAGATPFISVSNFYVQDYVNAVNDTVNGRTTAATNMNKVPFYYGPTGAFYSGQAFTLDLNTFVQSPHSGNGTLTEVFGTTSSNETLVGASGTSTDLSIGGIGFRMPNRSMYGQTPELFAKMTYAFPGGMPNTQQWEFIPAKIGGDNSTRWIGDPSYRWDEIYSADVNTTTATVGTLNVTTCNGCGGSFQQVNSDWNASSGVAQILNKPALAAVATSGSYNDLSNKPAIPAQGAHLVSGTMQGNTATLTGNSADQTIYTATLPAGTFTVGTGAHCWAKWQHTTSGSTAITYKWTLGSTAEAYAAFTSASQSVSSDIEVLTPAALTSQIINLSAVIAGNGFQAGQSFGNAGSENLANADTIKLTFNAGSGEQVKGVSFYCQTVQ